MNHPAIPAFFSSGIPVFLSALINIGEICVICGFVFFVKNGAAAHTLIMQNEPKHQTTSFTVTHCLLMPSACWLRPDSTKNEPKTNPNEPKIHLFCRLQSPRSGPNGVASPVRAWNKRLLLPKLSPEGVTAKKRNKPNFQTTRTPVNSCQIKTKKDSQSTASGKQTQY